MLPRACRGCKTPGEPLDRIQPSKVKLTKATEMIPIKRNEIDRSKANQSDEGSGPFLDAFKFYILGCNCQSRR